ncbi:MAG: helix-turn-helix domain-containing protein [Sulfuricella denitrificans]|nr:helix-turn-helix domain-containing protein [Sulfuricella denitrificans]
MSDFTFPNIGTMPSRTLALLLQGREITHLDFWRTANTYRLSDPVYQLRRAGWDVQGRRETVPTGDPTKRSASVSRYHLPDEVISAAGEDGRDYVRRAKEWERKASGMAGTGATAPAVESAGTNGQGTNQAKDSTGGAQ